MVGTLHQRFRQGEEETRLTLYRLLLNFGVSAVFLLAILAFCLLFLSQTAQ